MIVLNIDKMPEGCKKCRFYNNGYCSITHEFITAYPKLGSCPIIGEIPDVMTYTIPDGVDIDSFLSGVDFVFSFIEDE